MEWDYSNYSEVDGDVKRFFPFGKARQRQLETISEIKHAIDRGYKYIVLEAGTGTGKSAIAATLASIYDSTYILTVTKQLQDQYLKDFKNLGFKLVKGRGNFPCRKYGEDSIRQNCDEGRCIIEGYKCEYALKNNLEDKITREGTCYYDCQKFLGLISPVVISNYHYLFLELNYVGDFQKRQLMIFDEAHKLEESIMSLLKLEFDRKELKEYANINLSKDVVRKLNAGDYKYWIGFIERIKEIYLKEFNKIRNIKNRPELNAKRLFLMKRIEDCNIFEGHIKHDPEKWIFDYDSRWGVAQFKPIKVDKYAKDTFFRHGDVCIFMSATILDYRLFAEWLGIDEDEIYAIRQKSPFEINRNPIKTFKGFNMSFNSLEDSAQATIPLIKDILAEHKNDKGIIHTVSYGCKNYLKRKLESPRLIDHKTHNRSKQLKKFKNSSNPLVLISPSMSEGVDLPGELCRFQIIYKIPYPNVMDKQTSLRMRMDSKWFKYKTSLALVQTVGRGMRYEEDYCTTYFIDSRLKGFVRMDKISNHFLPDSFIEAIDIEPAMIDDKKEERVDEFELEANPSDALFERVMSVKPSGSLNVERTIDELRDYRAKVNFKYSLILKGKKLSGSDAVKFYTELLGNELFEGDYHPYYKLAQLYDSDRDYDNLVKIISDFMKSGIFARKSIIRKFVNKLREMSGLGRISDLEIQKLKDEYDQKGKLNKNALTKFPVSYYLIKTNKNANNSKIPFTVDQFKQITQDASREELISVGDKLMDLREYERAIAYYEALVDNHIFEGTHEIYKKLATAYHKHHKYNDEVDAIVEFYMSGIPCSDTKLKWFKKQLKKTAKYGNFDYSLMKMLENGPEGAFKFIEKSDGFHEYSRDYFNALAKEITEMSGYVSDRDLLKHEDSEFVEITSNHDEINRKADLKNRGRELEREDELKAAEFYDSLKKDPLFRHDYYPYRRQCILFKNKIKDDQRDWDTIAEIFSEEIYLNKHQLIWLKNKIYELIGKLDLNETEIIKMKDLVENHSKKQEHYKKLQGEAIPIAERIFKEDDELKLLSNEKYEMMQEIFFVKELGVGYIRRREFETAMRYYSMLLNSEFLYYRYHAFKQFGRIINNMKDKNRFKELYEKLV